ncbi:TolC family protein [Viscerimonas tarda]
MKKLILISLFLVAYGSALNAQTTYNLTLEESIEIAKEKSFSMKRLQQDLKIAEYNLKSATSRLKTHIDLSLNIPTYSETIGSGKDTAGVSYYFPVKELSTSGNLTINQPLPTDGRIYIQSNLSVVNNLNADQQHTEMKTSIGFEQPLDAIYGYNAIKSALKQAELAYEQSNKVLKREELNLVYQVSNSYYNLLSLQKSAEIAALDLERQTGAHEISKNKFEAGLIREVDALQMEVDLAEAQNNYDIAILNQVSAINSFKELLGVDLNDNVTLSSELKYEVVIVNPEKAVELALKNRLEIREQEIQMELQKLSIKRQKAEGMVRGRINANLSKFGMYNNPLYDSNANVVSDVGFLESINKSYSDLRNRPLNYNIGFTITVPILDWGENRNQVRATESRLKQITLRKEEVEREIETEVKNLVSNINGNLRRLQLLEKNVEVAEKSFEITRQRYSDGDIDSQALSLERTRLNTAYRTHLSAYINYQLSLADIMRKTFFDFRNQQAVE